MTDEVEIHSNVEDLELYSNTHPFRLPLRIRNFENEGEYKKFISNCERMIRNSIEYKLWRDYIKDVLQIQTCAITDERMGEVTIEVHHHIPSLFVLVKALINQKIERDEDFCTFDIAIAAIQVHYQNKIGYVTLIKTMHEKVHNGYLTIPMSLVKGDYHHFVRNYSEYLDEEDIDTINRKLAINESNCSWSRDEYPASNLGG